MSANPTSDLKLTNLLYFVEQEVSIGSLELCYFYPMSAAMGTTGQANIPDASQQSADGIPYSGWTTCRIGMRSPLEPWRPMQEVFGSKQ